MTVAPVSPATTTRGAGAGRGAWRALSSSPEKREKIGYYGIQYMEFLKSVLLTKHWIRKPLIDILPNTSSLSLQCRT